MIVPLDTRRARHATAVRPIFFMAQYSFTQTVLTFRGLRNRGDRFIDQSIRTHVFLHFALRSLVVARIGIRPLEYLRVFGGHPQLEVLPAGHEALALPPL